MMNRRRSLFYPVAGGDIHSPLESFIAEVESFWFVDNAAYTQRAPKIKACWEPKLVETFRLGTAMVKRYLICTDYGNGTAEVNLVNGDGENLFANTFGPTSENELTVFYYRGDSCGEGGSGICWLSEAECECGTPGLLPQVLRVLRKPGLIVTDGSNGHDGFRKFFRSHTDVADAHLHSIPFCFGDLQLSPIATVGMKYGPTVVWQVR